MKKIKNLLVCLVLGFTVMALSGCSGGATVLTNATDVLGEVAERNKAVIQDLYTQGIISESQYKLQTSAIENNVQAYMNLFDSTEINNSVDTHLKSLQGALVARIGTINGSNGEYIYGFSNDDKCPYTNHGISFKLKEHSLWGATNSEEYATLLSLGGSKYNMQPHDEEWANEHPLEFLDDGALQSLENELQRKVYILNPDSFKNESDWRNCIEILNNAKKLKESGNSDTSVLMSAVKQYFKPSAYTAYDFDIDDLLVVSQDNSSQIGMDAPKNQINYDIVISGNVEIDVHKPKKDAEGKITGCEPEDSVATIGVYSFRVKEFNKDFINLVEKDNFTTNRYVEVQPDANDGSQGIVLLMEYPVAVIESLNTTGLGHTNWEFEFKESSMRVNIYNGEMLIKNSEGEYVNINNEEKAEDRIYRVYPEAIGTNSQKGTTTSFIPYTKEVEGKSNIVETNPDDPLDGLRYLQLTEIKNASSISNLNNNSPFIGFKDNVIVPFYYLYNENFSVSVKDNIYTIKDKSTNEIIILKGEKKSIENYKEKSLLWKCAELASKNLSNIDELWAYYNKIATKLGKSENVVLDGNESGYILDELYQAWKETYFSSGMLDTEYADEIKDKKIGDLFSPILIYNSFINTFGAETLGTLKDDLYLYYDNHYIKEIEELSGTFTYKDPNDYSTYYTPYTWTGYIEAYSGVYHEDLKNLNIDGYKDLYDSENEVLYTYAFDDLFCILNSSSTQEEIESLDPYIGEIVDVSNRLDSLYYDENLNKYVIKYLSKEYYAQAVNGFNQNNKANVVAIEEMDTLYLALTDYLELMFMPDVIESEPFIAPGRRVKITKFEGDADEVIGYYADKYGDPVLLNDNKITVKVSDFVDYTSGTEGFYENVAKALGFDGRKNTSEVEAEIAKSETERIGNLKDLLVGGATNGENSGLLSDKPALDVSAYFESINPVLQFTSYKNGDRPGLDAMDVGNDNINPSLYYGLCLNTHAFATGLYSQWLNVDEDTDAGSLSWWNGWLSDHGYQYYIDFNTLKSAMSGVYNISLAELDDTIVFDLDVLNNINKGLKTKFHDTSQSLIRTVTVLIGSFLLIYGLLLVACWFIDVNLINGPGFLSIISGGRFVAMRDMSEMPRMSDGRTYVDFKYLMVVMVLLMVVGIILITVDIHSIWSVIKNLFSGVIDLFKNLMLNR